MARALGLGLRTVCLSIMAQAAVPGGSSAQVDVADPAMPEAAFDRFWIGAGVGAAGARVVCDLCDPSRELGASAEVAFGSYARTDLRVGIEAGGWTHDDEGSRESVYRAGVVAYLRPRLDRGAYLHGGFGWTRYNAGDFHFDSPRLTLGAGWDSPLGPSLRVGNQLSLDASSFGRLRNGDTTIARQVGLSLVRVTVQLYRP